MRIKFNREKFVAALKTKKLELIREHETEVSDWENKTANLEEGKKQAQKDHVASVRKYIADLQAYLKEFSKDGMTVPLRPNDFHWYAPSKPVTPNFRDLDALIEALELSDEKEITSDDNGYNSPSQWLRATLNNFRGR